jgi:SNF2 family DNA or RNA helicase
VKLEAIIHHKQDAKYLAFRKKLIDLGWYGRKRDFRIVVFAERIETLKALKKKLQRDFDLDDSVIADFHGSLTDMEQQRIIDDFGKEDSDYRILLTSDAGSQGVNLHYYCNHMFNYDIPWSLITLEQRNGRIDRYGQTKTPFIHYMVATCDLDGLRDDLHIVNKLKEKEEAVYQSLGDAASVYKLYEASAEEELVTTAIATGNRDMLDGAPTREESDDWFDALFDESTPRLAIKDPIVEEVSLFENDKSYYTALLEQLKSDNSLKTDDACFEGDLLEVKNTPELDRILYDLPKEAKPGGIGDVYQLSLNREDVQKAISDARKRKGEWARFQMLYELHPVVRYLMTQLEASVDKDVAFVSKINLLPKHMAYYLIQGLVANNLGQSILSDLFVVPMHRSGGLADRQIKFVDFLREHQINKELYTVEITDKEIEIETILNRSSQYFKDLTSLNSVPNLKVLAVFYN